MPSAPLAAALLAAARIVAAVRAGRNLDDVYAAATLDGPLRAAVRDLSWSALRRFGRGEFMLGRLMEKPLRDAEVVGLLLCALYRVEIRPDDAHTTVDQAVDAAGDLARGRYRALVNGVLRSFLRRQEELSAAAATDRVARWQCPAWWLDRLASAYPDAWQDIAAAGNGHPPMCLRVNRRQTDAAAYVEELAAADIVARMLDATAVMLTNPVAVERLPGFDTGRVSVQDWGAQQAASLLAAQPGMRVLDACAAPGGKTGHVLECAAVDMTALDADAARAARVSANLTRLGFAATVAVADCADLPSWWDGAPFERILADVPCSASGVLRRHPDIKWLRRPGDVAKFARQQARILEALWHALAPGGRMLYCTCSVFPEENGRQVAAFVKRHENALRVPLRGQQNELQWLPGADHDGFYYALLEKHA